MEILWKSYTLSKQKITPSNKPLKTLGEAMLHDAWFILCLGMINTPPLLPMCVRMQMCEASEANGRKMRRQADLCSITQPNAETIGTPPKQEKLRHLRPAQVFSQER